MFIFAIQILLTLSLGGIFLLAARKIPVLLALPVIEEVPAIPKQRKVLLERVKELSRYRSREIFNSDDFEVHLANQTKEDGAARPEEFEQNPDYWQKVKGK